MVAQGYSVVSSLKYGDRLAQSAVQTAAYFVQDLQSVESVSSQLHSFQKGMEQDSKAQQLECTKVIAGAIKRAEKLVDSTLQVVSRLEPVTQRSWGFLFGMHTHILYTAMPFSFTADA